MRTIITQLMTEVDNQTWCPVRLFGVSFAVVSSAVFLALAVWTVIKQHNALDYVAFGTGLSTVWATVSAAIIAKGRWSDRK